jgi:hypothetical protein
MRKAAGILMIISGLFGGILWSVLIGEIISSYIRSGAQLSYEQAVQTSVALSFPILIIKYLPGFLAMIGGYYALKRKHWGWALTGAICSLISPLLGIPAVILLIKSKSEFQG